MVKSESPTSCPASYASGHTESAADTARVSMNVVGGRPASAVVRGVEARCIEASRARAGPVGGRYDACVSELFTVLGAGGSVRAAPDTTDPARGGCDIPV